MRVLQNAAIETHSRISRSLRTNFLESLFLELLNSWRTSCSRSSKSCVTCHGTCEPASAVACSSFSMQAATTIASTSTSPTSSRLTRGIANSRRFGVTRPPQCALNFRMTSSSVSETRRNPGPRWAACSPAWSCGQGIPPNAQDQRQAIALYLGGGDLAPRPLDLEHWPSSECVDRTQRDYPSRTRSSHCRFLQQLKL
jgi:hypothetical protein